MGKIAKPQALRAMSLAFDQGITHFDIARSYGFGRGEEVLGIFAKGRRDRMTITSKFGVVPPEMGFRTKALIPLARALTAVFPGLKKKLKKKSGQLLSEKNFHPSYARQCLDQSLVALRTDYLDIYLVHEPDALLLGNPDELSLFMENSIRAGKIRRWGFAYQAARDYEWARALGGDVIQFEGNIQTLADCKEILGDSRQRLVTRPFGGGLNSLQSNNFLRDEPGARNSLEYSKISQGEFSLSLARRLAGESGSILCSMFSDHHIKENAEFMRRKITSTEVNLLIDRQLMHAEPLNRMAKVQA